MKTILHLKGNTHGWSDLLKHKKILCNNVRFSNYTGLFTENSIFPNVENVFVENCNSGFILHSLNKHRFPNAKNLFLNSNPYFPATFCHKYDSIFVTEKFINTVECWGSYSKNSYVITSKEFYRLLDSYVEDPIILSEPLQSNFKTCGFFY